ncbi:MAG: non-specific serine/threonine protein kinase [Candidatus Bathyarchaeota archaeon B63]|nr:MAG: non-specific serine/threonine protein kinase [Candidatus Bathyarchaeota archaeon B63]
MIWRGKPVIFDVSQAVPLEHPNADQFLMRDIENINRYFRRLGVEVQASEEIFRRITGASAIR